MNRIAIWRLLALSRVRRVVRFFSFSLSLLKAQVWRNLVQLAALAGAVYLVVWRLTNPTTDFWELLWSLAAVLALLALGVFGNQMLLRLKKVGPVEFFEQRVSQALLDFDGFEAENDVETIDRIERELTASIAYTYKRADAYVQQLEFQGLLETDSFRSKAFFVLLRKIGRTALDINDWARATSRFELLLQLSKRQFEPSKTLFQCGAGYLFWAVDKDEEGIRQKQMARAGGSSEKGRSGTKKDRREELMVLAQERFQEANRLDGGRALSHYFLAYCQDELGQIQPAICSLEKALALKPSLAAAKLNMAVSQVKLKDFSKALYYLKSISRSDKAAATMVGRMLTDDELFPLTCTEPWKSHVYDLLGEQVSGFLEDGEVGKAVATLKTAFTRLRCETAAEKKAAIEELFQRVRSMGSAANLKETVESILQMEQQLRSAWSAS
jgi:tetratricopeptide (TPR) repeat protein